MAPIKWTCRKCGKKVMTSENPNTNNTNYGKCPKSSDGKHVFVKG